MLYCFIIGKKSFGKAAAEVLNVSVDFAENLSTEAQLSPLLFERTGLTLTRQLLELTQVLAESTAASSPSVHEQAATTHRLLCFIAARLNDDRICAELLQPVSTKYFETAVIHATSVCILYITVLYCTADTEGRHHCSALLLAENTQVPALPGLHLPAHRPDNSTCSRRQR